MKTIALGSDPNTAQLKKVLIGHIQELGYELVDYGSNDPIYADVAIEVAEAVARGEHERGILICGTGIGMSISANKVPGVITALCAEPYGTERSRKSNNANIQTMGSSVMGPELAKMLVTIWMESEYQPGARSETKIQRIIESEERNVN